MSDCSIQLFHFESQEIRFIDGKPVANDVAAVLGYRSPANAVNRLVKEKNKTLCKTQTVDGKLRDVTVLEEAGIYQLIFSIDILFKGVTETVTPGGKLRDLTVLFFVCVLSVALVFQHLIFGRLFLDLTLYYLFQNQ